MSLKAILSTRSQQSRADCSQRLCDRIAASEPFQSASIILAYAAMPTELSLDPLIVHALGIDKIVCIPSIDWGTKAMHAVRIRSLDKDLVIGRYGLRSPLDHCQSIPDHEIPLALIPGLGFDASGRRLGRGGGFYDRWIESRRLLAEPVMMVGVGFDEQIVACVPADAHDQRMDRVVTPTTHYESTHG